MTLTARPGMQVNLAVQHMLAAARFSREVGQREREQGALWESIFHPAIGCILTVAASLEAYANELFSDRKKAFPEYSEELLHNLWETYEKKSVVEKFEFALLLRRKPNLNHGSRPVQDIDLLVQLRNALTHFKPELDTQADKHKKLSDRLGSKIKASPFFSSDALLFPRRWASHDCTTWAVHSAIAFAEHFEELAMFPPKYAGDHTAFQP